MSAHNDGGPAFPSPETDFSYFQPGMDLRDWFAGQALAGMSREYRTAQMYTCEFRETCESIAESAYELADAMLKAREVKP